MKKIIFLFLPILFLSCEYLKVETKKEEGIPVASVGDVTLYEADIKDIFPSNISLQDSLLLAKSYINSWATQQLLLQKAEENISEVNSNEINDLVKNYKESLFINGYKERLIKQQLDTIIKPFEIARYYKNLSLIHI